MIRHPCYIFAFLIATTAFAQSEADLANARKHLDPVLLELTKKSYTLSEVIEQIEKQTGNKLLDRRTNNTNPSMPIEFNKASFWPAVETVAQKYGCDFSVYQENGVALIDGMARSVPVSHEGIFRTVVKRVGVSRDLMLARHHCMVTVETMWEPRFQPFYLDVDEARIEFGPDSSNTQKKATLPSQGQHEVAGRSVLDIDLRFPAPARSSATIARLEGKFRVLGPSKMLTFIFEDLDPKNPAKQTREGATVQIVRLSQKANLWSAELRIEQPTPGGRPLESFQSWTQNNRIELTRTAAGKKQLWVPEPGDLEVLKLEPREALIRYYFRDPQGKGTWNDWTLRYTTPGQIVEVEVPFAFTQIPLP